MNFSVVKFTKCCVCFSLNDVVVVDHLILNRGKLLIFIKRRVANCLMNTSNYFYHGAYVHVEAYYKSEHVAILSAIFSSWICDASILPDFLVAILHFFLTNIFFFFIIDSITGDQSSILCLPGPTYQKVLWY